MVLKKCVMFLLYIFVFIGIGFTEDVNNFWIKTFSDSFNNTTEIIELRNQRRTFLYNYGLQKRMWVPNFSLEIPATYLIKRGDSVYSKNQNLSSEYVDIVGTDSVLTIIQRLPGNGYIQGGLGYSVQYYKDRNQFIQNPYINVGIFQPLSSQMFNPLHDSKIQRGIVDAKNNELLYYQEMYNKLYELINKLQNYEIQLAQKEYYQALVLYNQEKKNFSSKKYDSGSGSLLEDYYSEQELLSAKHEFSLINFNLSLAKKELLLVFPLEFDLENLMVNIEDNKNQLLSILTVNEEELKEKTITQNLLLNYKKQNLWAYKEDKLSIAPEFYASASVKPDGQLNYLYSDWYESWRRLLSSPYPVEVQFSLGLRINFDIIGQKYIRRKNYLLEEQNLESLLKTTTERQEKEKVIIQNDLQSLEQYNKELISLIKEEQQYRKDKLKLREQRLITQLDYLQSELLYLDMKRRSVETFWQIITKKMQLYSMTNKIIPLITMIEEYKDVNSKEDK